MIQEKIDRINFLAGKSKTDGLTEEEIAEQKMLRDEYRDDFKKSLNAQLDSIVVVEHDGRKHKLEPKK